MSLLRLLFPPLMFLPFIILGIILAGVINFVFPVPFLAVILASVAVSYFQFRRLGLRPILGYFFYIGGAQAFILGLLVLLGVGLVVVLSVAISVFSPLLAAFGALIAFVLIGIGMVLFLLGNLILGRR